MSAADSTEKCDGHEKKEQHTDGGQSHPPNSSESPREKERKDTEHQLKENDEYAADRLC